MPSIFLFVRSNANKESNAECERDVADSEGCTHKRIRRENDIGNLRFLGTWCTKMSEMYNQSGLLSPWTLDIEYDRLSRKWKSKVTKPDSLQPALEVKHFPSEVHLL